MFACDNFERANVLFMKYPVKMLESEMCLRIAKFSSKYLYTGNKNVCKDVLLPHTTYHIQVYAWLIICEGGSYFELLDHSGDLTARV